MKKVIFLSILSLIFTLGQGDRGFSQNLSDIEAEEIMQQKRALSHQGSANRDISRSLLSYEDLLNNIKEKFGREDRGLRDSRDTVWTSKNPDDLKPLLGTTWEFTFTVDGIIYTDTITFGTNIDTLNDGTVAIDCWDQYGEWGMVFFTEASLAAAGGRGYVALIEWSDEKLVNFYDFIISGNNATGYYAWKDDITGEYSDDYPMTGIKKNGSQAQPPVANAGPDQTVSEGNTVTLDGSKSSDPDDGIASYLWEQTSGPSVSLSSTAAVKPTFKAASGIQNNTSLTFKLTVTDSSGLKDTAIVIITVRSQSAVLYCPDGDIAPLGSPDGLVKVGDALLCMRFALGLEPGHPTTNECAQADVAPLDSNGCPSPNGKITVADALVILRLSLGIIGFSNCTPTTTTLTINLTGVVPGITLGSFDLTIDYDETKVAFNSVATGILTSWASVVPNDDGDTVRTGLILASGFDGGGSSSVLVFTFDIIQPSMPGPDDFIVTEFSAGNLFGRNSGLGTENVTISLGSSPVGGDNDGDGYTAIQGDCNDNDINIRPGATEICNDGKDNDCNGYIDCDDSHCLNDAACKICTDSDKDGYYLQSGCGTLVDCNDSDTNIHPGATEICGDGIDQDCNGSDKECSGPKPGHWSGSFAGGKDISFTVSDDSNYIYDFAGEFDCNGRISGKGSYSFTLEFSRPVMNIENNEFSGNVSTSDSGWNIDGSISGKFISSSTAIIEFRYTVKVPDFGSDSGYSYGYVWHGYH